MNIFKLTKEYFEAPKRNVYDLSYTSNLTAKFGYLYPVFIKEVNPGDSMSIQTTFGLRAEPMVFPVQSRMRADIHYFYVRNRTLWSGWMDFYGKLDDTLEHPYINQTADFFKTGSLSDYLGVPTSKIEEDFTPIYFPANGYDPYGNPHYPSEMVTSVSLSSASRIDKINDPFSNIGKLVNSINSNTFNGPYVRPLMVNPTVWNSMTNSYLDMSFTSYASPLNTPTNKGQVCPIYFTPTIPIDDLVNILENLLSSRSSTSSNSTICTWLNTINRDMGFNGYSNTAIYIRPYFGVTTDMYSARLITVAPFIGEFSSPTDTMKFSLRVKGVHNNVDQLLNLYTYVNEAKTLGKKYVFLAFNIPSNYVTDDNFLNWWTMNYLGEHYFSPGNICQFPSLSTTVSSSGRRNAVFPWVDNATRTKLIKLNALPFRAYEAIYNSFYRNYMNDPFMLNGKPQYNRFVTNLDGGADSTMYSLKRRNWELDFLTSAQQSPQQGEAPLVGITVNNATSTATMKFKSTELENAGVQDGIVTAEVKIDDDTNMIGINYYDKDLPQSNLQRLMEAINYGISINDLRQTTSLQRWLEKNIRRGYRYIDQIKSHFGVDLSYKDLLMPEFIGGCSEIIQTNTISQTTPTSDSPLGAYGGQATAVGQSRNNVSHYCDEAGFIIGIMSIVPTPVYSQVPNQFFYKENVLDYYFPEFGKIGMQPIYNRDITPLQTPESDLEKVFGYQRPWWHLISSIDEVHGEFRTSRQGYLIQRVFQDTPILNGDFLTIDNDSINNVFYVDDSVSDQFLGQLHFQVTRKTAIPLHGIPAIN